MKTEDFERLKAVCEKDGFTIESYSGGKTAIIGVKDIWEGGEFAESLIKATNQYSIGRIYKVKEVTDCNLLTEYDDRLSATNGHTKSNFKPSTESAYVDQLKKEAFERFGEIRDGDRFDESSIDGYYLKSRLVGSVKFEYHKCVDILCVGEVTLYRQGKWATKLKERVRVTQADLDNRDMRNNFHFRLEFASNVTKGKEEIINFLSEQLEKYLNDEI